jgi:hypothetical protein
MGSENSKPESRRATAGNGETQLGPEEFPLNEEFEGANAHPGDVFGDKSSRRPDAKGASLAMGLSSCEPFDHVDPDELGEGRDDSTGKPDGPERGPVDNGGAGAKLQWG